MNIPPCRRPNSHTPASVVPVTYFRNMPTSSPAQVRASSSAITAKTRPTGEIPAEPAPSSCTGVAAEASAGAGIIGRLLARGRRDVADEMTPVR